MQQRRHAAGEQPHGRIVPPLDPGRPPLGAAPVQPDGGDITSNAGALLLGQVDRGLGLMRRFAACFTDRRDPRFVEHQVETLVGQRIYGLALGYEDLVDHDELRKDPTLAVLAGKSEPVLRSDCEALAGKSTLNRLEHTPKRHGTKYHKIDQRNPRGRRHQHLSRDSFLGQRIA
jgi:Transposase DDE domain group 1